MLTKNELHNLIEHKMPLSFHAAMLLLARVSMISVLHQFLWIPNHPSRRKQELQGGRNTKVNLTVAYLNQHPEALRTVLGEGLRESKGLILTHIMLPLCHHLRPSD